MVDGRACGSRCPVRRRRPRGPACRRRSAARRHRAALTGTAQQGKLRAPGRGRSSSTIAPAISELPPITITRRCAKRALRCPRASSQLQTSCHVRAKPSLRVDPLAHRSEAREGRVHRRHRLGTHAGVLGQIDTTAARREDAHPLRRGPARAPERLPAGRSPSSSPPAGRRACPRLPTPKRLSTAKVHRQSPTPQQLEQSRWISSSPPIGTANWYCTRPCSPYSAVPVANGVEREELGAHAQRPLARPPWRGTPVERVEGPHGAHVEQLPGKCVGHTDRRAARRRAGSQSCDDAGARRPLVALASRERVTTARPKAPRPRPADRARRSHGCSRSARTSARAPDRAMSTRVDLGQGAGGAHRHHAAAWPR